MSDDKTNDAKTNDDTTHVFAGTPDARQLKEATWDTRQLELPTTTISRFRPTYRALTTEEKALHDDIKSKAAELEALYAKCGPSRYNSLALTTLEESVMWAVKGLTS